MLVPTRFQMKEINERSPDIIRSLIYWRDEAFRLNLHKTFGVMCEALKVCGWEVDEVRNKFEGSGRRSRSKKS